MVIYCTVLYCYVFFSRFDSTGINYLLSLFREIKGGKISDIQNNTNKSKRVLVTDITVTSEVRDSYIHNQHEFG